jgi:DNA-binding response OmpR family regulator
LVVEDNPDTRELLHLYFKNAGFTVVTASDGSEGLYMAKAEKPDLILTDLAMPKMDGMEMIRKLREAAETAPIPIVIFTAHGSVSVNDAKEAGADQVFYKPFDFEELVKVVRLMIQNNQY